MTFNLQTAARFLRSTTARLALSYLVIIMVLSLGFSFVLFRTSANELDREVPPASLLSPQVLDFSDDFGYHHFFETRIEEAKSHLIDRLIILNLLVLLGGAALSYYLARRTLQPIEGAMEAQSRFVTDASHELRTPLTAILASNEVALRKPHITLKQAKDVIKSNVEEITRLKNLSDGLLNLSKQNVILDNKQPVPLQDAAGAAMNHVLPAAQAKEIAIQDNVPAIKVAGDTQSLVQLVTILLDNAIKYSPDKSTVYMTGHHKAGQGYLSIRDEGIGISPKDLPHIFDRFYRADLARTASDTSGHGIGLSIAQQIIEQHGGRIIVNSAPKHGSTFTVQLPLV